MVLTAIVIKELRLLGRDIHGLALLFAMPVVFIVIMSLALKEDFDRRSGVQLEVLVDDHANSDHSRAMLERLGENPLFRLRPLASASVDSPAEARAAVGADSYHFLLTVTADAFVEEQGSVVTVLAAPGNGPELNQLLVADLRAAAAAEKMALLLQDLAAAVPQLEGSDLSSRLRPGELVELHYAGGGGPRGVTPESAEAPTSVQQNVPAWLVFSMFFAVVPLANTLIKERQLGTLRRLRTIDVANWQLLAGKIVPYFAINQIQVVAMLLVGVYLVPLLGGDRLALGQSPAALALMAAALSLAALGYGMLIAVISKTTEQATTLGGAGNIILAALGGIMVPTFVMPEFMQAVSVVSPMSWGLQGFLDVLLRGGGLAQVWPEALSLLALGAIALGLAALLWQRDAE